MGIKQNDPALNGRINKIGCFFRSAGIIAELETGKKLTAEQINGTWDWAKQTGAIDEQDNVVSSAMIANHFLALLGDKGRFYEVGIFKHGESKYYLGIAKSNPQLCRADYLIQKVRQNGPSKYHFRVVDKAGNLIEDPHEPVINVVSVEYTILYAYEKKRK